LKSTLDCPPGPLLFFCSDAPQCLQNIHTLMTEAAIRSVQLTLRYSPFGAERMPRLLEMGGDGGERNLCGFDPE
jgi:hypothetical protein